MRRRKKKVYPEQRRRVFVATRPKAPCGAISGGQVSGGRKPVVFVAMSGGVDSSVAAALLQEQGYDVVGVYMKNWAMPANGPDATVGVNCTWEADQRDARRVAAKLGIPFYTFDFEREYRTRVVEYMVREYASGRTPNPDVMCNREIKFGVFLEKALSLGAEYVATGHYVRLVTSDKKQETRRRQHVTCHMSLVAARDSAKDQSYFLWTLTQQQLAHCLFPIGEYTKPEVRELARKFALPTAEKKDSQGLCFVGKVEVREFLKHWIPEKRGALVTPDGKTVGEHEGASFYTIGQRKGVGSWGGGTPWYVVGKNLETNTVVVAEETEESLWRKELIAESTNWISGEAPKFPFRCEARIRYRQQLQSCRVERQVTRDKRQGGTPCHLLPVTCHFDDLQRAITPGQAIVFYKDGELLGGGIIA